LIAGERAPRGRGRCHVLVAGVYLGIVLLLLRATLPAPAERLPFPAMLHATQWFRSNVLELDRQDQAMVVATVTRNAHLLTTRPAELLGAGQCHPMPRSHTLGEHMFGFGLLAAVPYAATGDPIASFNAALGLGLWIAALAMYALVFHFTGHPAAAFVGGLAFLLLPPRIANPAHPYVHADLWTPLVLLFLHRVFTRQRLRDALLLGLFASLQILESFYPLLVCLLYLVPFAAHLLVTHRRRLGASAGLLAIALLPAFATAALVLGPYLETRGTWGLLGDRATFFLLGRELGPGQFHFIGWSLLALVAIGLVDRARRPLDDDARIALAAGAALVAWCALGHLRLLGVDLPSPIVLLRGIVPGLDAVRAIRAIASGVDVGTAFLAGHGLFALARGRGRAATIALTAAASLALLALPSYGPLSRATFGRLVRLDAYEARPPAEDIALLRAAARGALVDLPLPHAGERGHSLGAGRLLLFASYSPRATATCYNSFAAPTTDDVARLARALPDAAAARALASLGFGTVLLHKERFAPEERAAVSEAFAAAPGVLAPAGETPRLAVYHLPEPPAVQEDLATLRPPDAAPGTRETIAAAAPSATVAFTIANRSNRFFRHPAPLAPSDLELLWRPLRDGPPRETSGRALLPLALAPGAVATVRVETSSPAEPGAYRVDLRRAGGATLATTEVDVTRADAEHDPKGEQLFPPEGPW
jgi:hypothetical protein